MKNILITGGAGFLGKNLIKYIKNEKNTYIIVIDNFASSSLNEYNMFLNEFEITNIVTYEYDIVNNYIFQQLSHVDEIYHFASIASPILYKKNALKTLDVGYIGTRNVLEFAKKYNSKVLFASTSEIYGNATRHPQDENYYGNVNSFGERSCYDESKRIAESQCFTFINEYGLDIKIARIFNTYGPYMNISDGRIITECIKNLMNDTCINIFGDGKQTRSYCYVDDTIDMLYKLMSSNYNKPINIGNDEEISINDTINIIEQIYRKKLEKKYIKLTQNDPLQRKPDLILNKQILGDREYLSFENGIKKMINFFNI